MSFDESNPLFQEVTSSSVEDAPWIEPFFVGRAEHIRHLFRIFTSGKRVAILEGWPGSGKTALAHVFASQSEDLFPGGTAWIYWPDVLRKDFLAQEVLPSISETNSLLVVDEAYSVVDSSTEAIPRLLKGHPHLHILAISQPGSRLGATLSPSDIVRLGALTDLEIHEILRRRLLYLGKSEVDTYDFLARLEQDESIRASGRTIRDLIKAADRALATEFRYSGLVGPDGQPLSESSDEFRRVRIDLCEVNNALLRELKRDPNVLRALSPRRFEEVIAELLSRLGYEVSLTAASKDGGFDMYAARKTALGQFLYIVECKRYVPPNKVGVALVRALRGVLDEQEATAGILVTSSFFTAGAEEFQRKAMHRIQLKDYLGIQGWLERIST